MYNNTYAYAYGICAQQYASIMEMLQVCCLLHSHEQRGQLHYIVRKVQENSRIERLKKMVSEKEKHESQRIHHTLYTIIIGHKNATNYNAAADCKKKKKREINAKWMQLQ